MALQTTAHRLGALWRGDSLTRIFLHETMAAFTIRGRVLDVGAGAKRYEYHDHLKQEGKIETKFIDGRTEQIDFEKDALPFENGSIDTLICLNVLEHIFNHRFLLSEMRRVAAPGAQLIGFVPFLVRVHPDPHDYFRYTGEALMRLLQESDFKAIEIKTVGGGPFLVNFNMIVQSIPRPLRVLLYPLHALLDHLFLAFRPNAREKFPIGYTFYART